MKERIKHLILFIILICIDQASKYWVRTVLANRDPIVVIPKNILKLQYHTNTGAVWGIFSGKAGILSIFTFFVLLLILFLYFKIPQGKKYNALKIIVVFILAGAVGNLIDRVLLGHVVDFIYIEIINFPLFNFADSCLTISSFLLFILAIFYYKDEDFAFLDRIFRSKKAAKPVSDSKTIAVHKSDNSSSEEAEKEFDTDETDEADDTDETDDAEDTDDADNTDTPSASTDSELKDKVQEKEDSDQ